MSLRSSNNDLTSDEHWIPLSDLMSGLMMMFMLIAVLFMVQVEADTKKMKVVMQKDEQQAQKIKEIAVVYDQMKEKLYLDLLAEFKDDLPKWGAELDRDLAIRFKEPDVLFATGKFELRPRFEEILSDFFPRYIKILNADNYKNSIQEIRIEGHTSSVWNSTTFGDKAYLLNMELSQSRTRSVLSYLLSLPRNSDVQSWLIKNLTANGLSSSKSLLNEDGTENRIKSQRVEFRVRTDADARIAEILRAGTK